MAGKAASFSEFFVAEQGRLYRLAYFLTGDPDRATDLAQEAMAATYRRWRHIRDEDPGPYARQALVNLCRSARRRSFLERRHSHRFRDQSVSMDGQVEEAIRVAEALRVLSPVQRAAVVLRYYDDLSEADIASTLGRPIGTVKSDLSRALAKLRPILDETNQEV